MNFIINGTHHGISFTHRPSVPKLNHFGSCTCVIWKYFGNRNKINMTHGTSRVHEGDQYVKEIGRKKALYHAIKQWPRWKRKIIWTAYRERTRHQINPELENQEKK